MHCLSWASLVVQLVKNWHAMWETWVWSLVLDDHLEKGSATHSNILDWRILWTEELADNSEWDWKETDTTEPLSHYISYSKIHLIMHFIVFIFHQHFEGITALSLAFNVEDAKSDANMTGTFKVNHLLFPNYVIFCCWFYPLVFLNFIKLCLFLSLFFLLLFMDICRHYYIWRLGICLCYSNMSFPCWYIFQFPPCFLFPKIIISYMI